MFFPATEEEVQLDPDSEQGEPEYLSHNTFIICNPNAMLYQNTINFPHAYYLKLLAQN